MFYLAVATGQKNNFGGIGASVRTSQQREKSRNILKFQLNPAKSNLNKIFVRYFLRHLQWNLLFF